MSDKTNSGVSCRLGRVGGSALMEGVMMKSGNDIAMAVRRTDNGKITVRKKQYKSIKEKISFFKIPVIRGVVNFVETLILSMNTMTEATELLGIDDMEPESKFDKWLTEKLGDKMMQVISAIAVVLGVALSLVLFMWLPTFISGLIFGGKADDFNFLARCVDGGLKILIFIGYIGLTALIPDIKRVYMYHGAEHKSIACFESGDELTVENVRRHTRFHPRCGTSFMFLVLIVSIIVNSLLLWCISVIFPTAPINESWFIILAKFIALPLVVGLDYEYVMYAGKHDNRFTKIFSAPGLWMQRITTKEPDDSMMEVAICSIKSALPAEFPDFVAPTEELLAAEEAAEQQEKTEEVNASSTEEQE